MASPSVHYTVNPPDALTINLKSIPEGMIFPHCSVDPGDACSPLTAKWSSLASLFGPVISHFIHCIPETLLIFKLGRIGH